MNNEQKNKNPYDESKSFLNKNFTQFISANKEKQQIFSIKQMKKMVDLLLHFEKSEEDICDFIKSVSLKEFKDFDYFIDDSIERINKIEDSEIKAYYIEQQKEKTNLFKNINFEKNNLNPRETMIKAELEFIDTLKRILEPEHHSLYFDDLDKLQSIVISSNYFLQGKDIDNQTDLNLNQKNHFIYTLFNHKEYKKIERSPKEEIGLKPKMKKTFKLRFRPSLKKP